MSVKEKAFCYAYMAHFGDKRRISEKPYFHHPKEAAELLESMGCDDNLVAAAYLHDLIEEEKCTIGDMYSNFGNDITYLVLTATEVYAYKSKRSLTSEEKRKSWKTRKKKAIDNIKDKPLRNKPLVCADKIVNIST